MCGLVGYLGINENNDFNQSKKILNEMSNTLFHRGPDDFGDWIDFENQIFLAHRRLSILDLSINGRQPMISPSGRYLIVFNGEIYNHLNLRKELNNLSYSPLWKSSSDTETLLAGFDNWGIKKTIEKTEGMFAFAVWCRKSNTLTIGRDRLGEKPIYYGWQNNRGSNVFLFASELKAITKHPAFNNIIDHDSISLFLRYSNIPSPYSIYKNIFKLPPGNLLTVSLNDHECKIVNYWSLKNSISLGKLKTKQENPLDMIDSLERILENSIKQQMVADVPLGAFLSGGIDSSLIVSLMQKNSSIKTNTFTIGFDEKNFNEANYAKNVAKHLGTNHTELYVDSKITQDVIPMLPDIYDEPFSDSSQIPTYLISKLASEKVKVALSGDGGDEIFSGYNRYRIASSFWPKIKLLPFPLRKLLSNMILNISIDNWDQFISIFKKSENLLNFGEKMHKGGSLLKTKKEENLYLDIVTNWKNSENIVKYSNNRESFLSQNLDKFNYLTLTEKMMALDTLTYLPDDILNKVDRASMSVSLEARSPFLDKNVVEFAWSLPQKFKINTGKTKWILRQILYKYVPKNLIERPKVGFGVPIDQWLRGSLKDWAEDLLNENLMKNEGFFNTKEIRNKWSEHLNGKRNWHNHLWDVLMFQSWLRK